MDGFKLLREVLDSFYDESEEKAKKELQKMGFGGIILGNLTDEEFM